MTISWKQPTKLNPVRYKITYGAYKEFYDSNGVLQELPFWKNTIFLFANRTEHTIENLMPFTSYQVNVTAITADESFKPTAKITVTTAMAAPKPMVKPDFLQTINGTIFAVLLPQASEEHGPISHYYVAVIPEDETSKNPDEFTIEELSATPLEGNGPYIAGKFPRRSMPHMFNLGDQKMYGGYINRPLRQNESYKIFVRAVVDNPFKVFENIINY
ncbi:Tyrosine-protein phosphatase Lar-like protein [Leptotrombidium deliense]|uniref:Tyrosine-protein phosphatase Lar-like protein n=1 Tax=Leptotrombidium deliense TaxID=299467 RepID=A0A443RWU0_9ACAR|nr:Tyrosine-protein phosphatase Lar-like protein [Leptotrombidium deliense]